MMLLRNLRKGRPDGRVASCPDHGRNTLSFPFLSARIRRFPIPAPFVLVKRQRIGSLCSAQGFDARPR